MTDAVKEHPILFSGQMVRAILEGRKTQTRRVIKSPYKDEHGQPSKGPFQWVETPEGFSACLDLSGDGYDENGDQMSFICPYGVPGCRIIPSVRIPRYDNRYCVDVYGDVWSRAKGDYRRMKCGVTSKGYKTITPALDGKYKTQLVHRIVCESFYGRPPNGMTQVRHLNGNQKDNAPENLDWGTQEQNWRDRAAHGRGMGEDHHSSKLTHEDVKKIRCSDISQRNLAKIFNVSQSTIQSILSNDTWDLSKNVAPVNMPRSASRITLEITGVRAERLFDISDNDARSEGFESAMEFARFWDSISKPGEKWADNPCVWIIEFRRVENAQGE